MIGILLDSYYKTVSGMRILISCLGLLGICIILFIKNQLVVEMYTFVIFFTISVYSLIVNMNDLESGWSIYELILPIKRKNILKCKYYIYLFWSLFSVLITIIYLCGIVYFKGSSYFDLGVKDVYSIFVIAFSFSLQLCSWFYVIWYIVDFDKKEVSIIISILLSVSGIMFLIYLSNSYGVKLEIGRVVMVALSVELLVFSYIISSRKYIEKEY